MPTTNSASAAATATLVKLDVAERDRFPQRRDRIARGDELVRQVAAEAEVDDRAAHGLPVDLLRVVQLVAVWDAAGMKVSDVADVVADGADHVAFHDLHVVDVVEQLDPRRVDAFH